MAMFFPQLNSPLQINEVYIVPLVQKVCWIYFFSTWTKKEQKQQLSDSTQPCKKTKRETKRKCTGINTNNVEHCNDSNHIPAASTSTDNTLARPSRRASKVKFVGRRIKHQWIVDEDTDRREWYKGTVLSVLSGIDGDPTAVYDILYEGSDESYEVDHLLEDYRSSSLLFIDV